MDKVQNTYRGAGTGLPPILKKKDGKIIHSIRTCADCKQAWAGMNSV
jgi:hypothetical protein